MWRYALLLHCVGAEVKHIYKSLPVTAKLKDETDYAHTLHQLFGFYEPKVNVIAELYTFHQRKQSSTESTALRGFIVNCQFGALTHKLIRDQVVECTTHRCLCERFLQDSKLTLESVLSQAEAYEVSQGKR